MSTPDKKLHKKRMMHTAAVPTPTPTVRLEKGFANTQARPNAVKAIDVYKRQAQSNGVYFYPILVKKEAASWQEFCTQATDHLRGGTYAAYGEKKLDEFLKNLGG